MPVAIVFLLAMVVLAVASIQVKKAEIAVIYLGIFSLFNAIVYLFYSAPDLSLAEAVIGSALATALFLAAIKGYNLRRTRIKSEYTLTRSLKMRLAHYGELFWGVIFLAVGFIVVSSYFGTVQDVGKPAWDYYVRSFISDTGAHNAVTAIYLNYRVFDTLFEALLLLVCILATAYFLESPGRKEPKEEIAAKPDSEIVARISGLLYPFILLYGFYIIVNGHLTPGGGFQGGAILASVFIIRYFAQRRLDIDIFILQRLEKSFFLGITALSMLLLLPEFMNSDLKVFHLVLMNILIGFKVCCGLTILFFCFIFQQTRDEDTKGRSERG
ncbi:MAG: MnhB domain-containing protein [Pseudothermotoga sp.]